MPFHGPRYAVCSFPFPSVTRNFIRARVHGNLSGLATSFTFLITSCVLSIGVPLDTRSGANVSRALTPLTGDDQTASTALPVPFSVLLPVTFAPHASSDKTPVTDP